MVHFAKEAAMRKSLVVGIATLAVGFGAPLGGSAAAWAQGAPAQAAPAQQCEVTQGAYAIALAQALGFNVSTAAEALSALTGVTPPEGGIAPVGGWVADQCATADVVAQVRDSLKLADARYGAGTADSAFQTLSNRDHRAPVSTFKP
jgi:hypothetical protein